MSKSYKKKLQQANIVTLAEDLLEIAKTHTEPSKKQDRIDPECRGLEICEEIEKILKACIAKEERDKKFEA